MSGHDSTSTVRRREFLAGAAAAAAVTIVNPARVRGTQANSAITLGMIGCGGRGNWIAPRFLANGNYRFVACNDYFQERVDAFGEKYDVPADRRYTGLSGYRRLLEAEPDAVVIQSPPYFHPEQAADSVEAGRHVFLSKPVAVDVPGCKSIAKSGAEATRRKLVYLVDFQTRANPYYREATKRVHAGDIGRLVHVEARYPWSGGNQPPPATPEERLHRWYCIRVLSGDFIVEQHIHTLDVGTWFINADPIEACGMGASKGLRSYGDILDHGAVTYRFPDDVLMAYSGVQVIPGAPDEIPCRVFGRRGMVDTDYFSHVYIRGLKPYEGGKFTDLYDSGAINNIREFETFIREGHHANETVAPSVRSNLTAVFGRVAMDRKGKPVTWDEMMKADEKLELDTTGLKT